MQKKSPSRQLTGGIASAESGPARSKKLKRSKKLTPRTIGFYGTLVGLGAIAVPFVLFKNPDSPYYTSIKIGGIGLNDVTAFASENLNLAQSQIRSFVEQVADVLQIGDMKIIEEAELRSQKNREIQDLSKKLEFVKQKSKQLQDEIDDIQVEIRHAQARERQIQMQTESTGTDSTRLEGLSELGQSHFNGVFDEKRMKQEELLAKTEELREALSQSQDQLEVLAVKSANAETEIEDLKLQLESVLEENQQAQMAILGQNEVIASLRAELSLTKQQLDEKGRPRWSSWRSDNSDVGEDSSLASISGLLNQDANKEEVDMLKEKIERLQSMNAQPMLP